MSLVTTPTSQLATCAQCSGTRVTRISMTLTDGSLVDFASCHRC
jgi:predicted metal-binding protein